MNLISYIGISTVLLFSIIGCSSPTINKTYTSTGIQGYQITCGGTFGGGDISACYLAAGQICGADGYTVSHTGASSILISCKPKEEIPGLALPK